MIGTYLADYQKYGSDPFNDRIIDGKSKKLKLRLVKDGYGLDKLCDDPDPEIRKAVADRGYIKPDPSKETERFNAYNIIL